MAPWCVMFEPLKCTFSLVSSQEFMIESTNLAWRPVFVDQIIEKPPGCPKHLQSTNLFIFVSSKPWVFECIWPTPIPWQVCGSFHLLLTWPDKSWVKQRTRHALLGSPERRTTISTSRKFPGHFAAFSPWFLGWCSMSGSRRLILRLCEGVYIWRPWIRVGWGCVNLRDIGRLTVRMLRWRSWAGVGICRLLARSSWIPLDVICRNCVLRGLSKSWTPKWIQCAISLAHSYMWWHNANQ